MTRPAWFKCYPEKLLGALAGLEPDEGYLYVTILLRIYETGGPINDTVLSLSRRTGLRSTVVQRSLKSLNLIGKINQLDAGLIDSNTTHFNLQARAKALNDATIAGKLSAGNRKKKGEGNQRLDATTVERPLNGKATEGQRYIDIENIKDSDPNGSGANAPLKVEDPKELLFSEGLRWLRSLKPEDSDRTARGLLGKMLRDCGGDTHAGKLWGIICDARRERKADPIAWVCAVIDANRPRAGPAKPSIQNPAILSYLKHPVIYDDEPSPQKRRTIIDH